jgi:hypothetical protein
MILMQRVPYVRFITLLICILLTTSIRELKRLDFPPSTQNRPAGNPVHLTDYLDAGNYIRLYNTGASDNYSSYTVPASLPWGAGDSTVKTVWTKLKLDTVTMLINTSDFTYATSTGLSNQSSINTTKQPYGTAGGCSAPFSMDATARIDLRGTNFAIDDHISISGVYPRGQATFSFDNQVVEISVGGYCGYAGPLRSAVQGEAVTKTGGSYLEVKLVDMGYIWDGTGFYINLDSTQNWSTHPTNTWWPYDASSSNMTLNWNKLRYHPNTLSLQYDDYTYATKTGQLVWYTGVVEAGIRYGMSECCKNDWNFCGSAIFDISATQFQFYPTSVAAYRCDGWASGGTFTFSNNDRHIVSNGGGCCGGCGWHDVNMILLKYYPA